MGSAFGFFAGGASSGISAGVEQTQKKQQLDAALRKEDLDRAKANLEAMFDSADAAMLSLADKAQLAGKDIPQAEISQIRTKVIESGMQLAEAMRNKYGDASLVNLVTSLSAKLGAGLTVAERAAEKGLESQAKAQGERAAGNLPSQQVVNLDKLDPQGKLLDTRTVNLTTEQGLLQFQQLIQEGYTKQVTGRTESDPSRLGKTQAGKAQERVANVDDQLALLAQVESLFRPEFLTIAGKAKGLTLKSLEKAGVELSQAHRDFLGDKADFASAAIEVINAGIKLMTGAQMSEKEAERLRKQFPDPENDSPTEFIRKLRLKQQQLRQARARTILMLRSGVQHEWGAAGENDAPEGWSIDEAMKKLNERANAAYQQALSENKSDEEARRIARDTLREFGL